MKNLNPLFSLTVDEFSELLDEKLKQYRKIDANETYLLDTDNVSIEWVESHTKLKKSTIRSKVCKGEIPCKKKGKPLVFSKESILNWLDNGRPKNKPEEDFIPKFKINKL